MNDSYFAQPEHQGFLRVTGKDAARFLQGYVTCDMDELSEGQWRPGAICNLQGRMVTSFRIAATEGGFLLNMVRELVPATIDFLRKYIPFFKAEMVDASDNHSVIGLVGAQAESLLGALFDRLPDASEPVCTAAEGMLLRTAAAPATYELWLPCAEAAEMSLALAGTLRQESDTQWSALEIEQGLAWVTATTAEEFIPQMMNLQLIGGISFSKGCYLGQEIVARMEYRGQLKRRMARGQVASAEPVRVGDELFGPDDKRIGKIVAAANLGGQCHLLAVIQQSEAPLACHIESGTEIIPLPLPYITEE